MEKEKHWHSRQPWYEYKLIVSKGRAYRYWYLRFSDGGVTRSVYVGRFAPDQPALAAARQWLKERRSREPKLFREPRSRHPKPR